MHAILNLNLLSNWMQPMSKNYCERTYQYAVQTQGMGGRGHLQQISTGLVWVFQQWLWPRPWLLEQFSIEHQKLIAFALILHWFSAQQYLCHFDNHCQTKPTVTCTCAVSHAIHWLHVIASNSDPLILWCASVVIGWSNCFCFALRHQFKTALCSIFHSLKSKCWGIEGCLTVRVGASPSLHRHAGTFLTSSSSYFPIKAGHEVI